MKTFPCHLSLSLVSCATVLALFAGGCTPVISPTPVGETPLILKPAEWEGMWVASDGAFVVLTVINATAGQLKAAEVKESDGELKFEMNTLFLREANGRIFVSVLHPHEDKPIGYVWGRLKKDGDTIIVWEPDQAQFSKLVAAGKLKEKSQNNDHHDLVLEALTAENLQALTTGELGVPFNWDNPMVYHRVGKSDLLPEAAADKPASSLPPAPAQAAAPSDRNSVSASPPAR
jgi:hypothetical protein